MRQDPVYISVYITWAYLVFMYAVPFTGLSVLNMLMFLDVRSAKNDKYCTRRRGHFPINFATLNLHQKCTIFPTLALPFSDAPTAAT